jgi:hypothetical protein
MFALPIPAWNLRVGRPESGCESMLRRCILRADFVLRRAIYRHADDGTEGVQQIVETAGLA